MGDAAINPGMPLGTSKTVSADGISDGGVANPMSAFSIVKANDLNTALEIAKSYPFLEMDTAAIIVFEQMEIPQ